jgi:hypothetical protein
MTAIDLDAIERRLNDVTGGFDAKECMPDIPVLIARVRELETERERSDAIHEAVSNLSLCWQCQGRLENEIAEACRPFDADRSE